MRSFAAIVWLLALVSVAKAAERSPLDVAIDRGTAFLTKDALAWKSEHHCVSCHHAGLVIWALREAKAHGRAVDDAVLAELTKWTAESSGDGKTSVPRPEGIPQAFNEKAVSLALALVSDPDPDAAAREALKRLLQTVKEDQLDDGHWASWPETRPPIFGNSDERATLVATLALLKAADGGDNAAKAARDCAAAWLATTKSDDDPQSVALRVVLATRLGHDSAEIQPLAQRILERQNADGGWSQIAGMPSDAWATGQALFALAHAGLKADQAAIRAGQAFLVGSQRADGSWPMTSPHQAGRRGLEKPHSHHRRRQCLGRDRVGPQPIRCRCRDFGATHAVCM